MKRAPVKTKAIPPVAPPEKEVVRTCEHEGCTNPLKPRQKKYCSKVCRIEAQPPKEKDPSKGGKPPKYKPEYATTKFEEYIEFCEKGSEPTLIPTDSSFIQIPNAEMPSQDGYALFLKVRTRNLDNWAKMYPEFAETLDELNRIQKHFLLKYGLSGRYQSPIVKMALNVNHGMVEKKEVDTTHKIFGLVKHVYNEADRLQEREKVRIHEG